jgi:hypothetical protein
MFAPSSAVIKRREEPPRCPERPAFHLAPPNGGWVNDPNAPIVDKDGRVHVVSVGGRRRSFDFFDEGIGARATKPRASERRLWCEGARHLSRLLSRCSLLCRLLSPAEAGERHVSSVLVGMFR